MTALPLQTGKTRRREGEKGEKAVCMLFVSHQAAVCLTGYCLGSLYLQIPEGMSKLERDKFTNVDAFRFSLPGSPLVCLFILSRGPWHLGSPFGGFILCSGSDENMLFRRVFAVGEESLSTITVAGGGWWLYARREERNLPCSTERRSQVQKARCRSQVQLCPCAR
jgi:hypothetical protein